jgi:hypothetical protein
VSLEKVLLEGVLQAEILRASVEVDSTTFFSDEGSALQMGLMSHQTGFEEPAHFHPVISREDCATQQFFIVTEGLVSVLFYDRSGKVFEKKELGIGDSILLIQGIHSISVGAKSRCVTVKQGPFPGPEKDKVLVEVP